MSATKRARKPRLPQGLGERVASLRDGQTSRAKAPGGQTSRAEARRMMRARAAGRSSEPIALFSVGARGRLRSIRVAAARALRRLGPLRALIIVLVGLALGGGWLWFRDSSFVAVRQVKISGVSGPDARRIRAALLAAARGMSTLDVQTARLHTVVQPYPAVRALQVSAQFPHSLRIHVVEQLPAAVLTAAGQRLVISTDGTVLRDMRPPPGLPLIPVRALPVGPRVSAQAQLQELAVLMGAPGQLRSRIATLDDTAAHGVIVRLRQGPKLYFGGPGMVRAKWVAATVVLASRGAAGAVYIDVSDPQRPAAG